jgi:hypothetical protein
MATVAGPKQPISGKYDQFVEGQIEKARRRIRGLDLTAALLGFVAGTLAYAVVMALLDSKLTLPPAALYAVFVVYIALSAAYLTMTVIRPLTRRINPYFAARQVEQTLPGAKNSVVNWLDLHEEKLPPAIQSAVSQKAAKDLAKADLETAVSSRRAGWTGGAVGLLLCVLLVLLLMPGFGLFTHLERVFLPFRGTAAPSAVHLSLVEPEGGNATVTANRPVTFRVRVEGQVPEVIQLLTRPTQSDPEQERWLEKDPATQDLWVATVPAAEVKNGFYYRIIGGDASTPEFRIDVRSTPAFDTERFLATYQARPYIRKVARVVRKERTLKDYPGTRVTLDVPTNRKLREGELVLRTANGKEQRFPAQIDANDPQTMHISFPLTQAGKYVLRFTSVENEYHSDLSPYDVILREDNKPEVILKQPDKDQEKPADALVDLEGVASDDIGVAGITLRMKVENGPVLEDRPYRSEKELRLADGGFPNVLDYKDFIDLAKLQDRDGKAVSLTPGMVLELWLEARDACDQPKPNVGESQHRRITIVAAQKDPRKRQEQQKQAERANQEHRKQQDEKLKQQNAERRKKEEEQKKKNEEQRQEQKKAGEQGREGKGRDNKDPSKKADGGKEGKADPNDRGKPGEKKKPENSGEGKKTPEQERQEKEQRERDREVEKRIKKLEEELKEREKSKGKGDPEEQPRGEAKGNPSKDRKDEGNREGKSEKKDGAGAGKGSPDHKQPEEARGKEGGKPGTDKERGTGKNAGKPEMGDKTQGQGKKSGEPEKGTRTAESKGGPPEQSPERGQGKAAGKKEMKETAAQSKDAGKTPENQANRAEGKDSGKQQASKRQQGEGKGEKTRQAQGNAKEKGSEQQAGEAKPASKKGPPKEGQTAQSKPAGDGKKPPQGTSTAKGDKRGQDPLDKRSEQMNREDVEQLARDLKSDNPQRREQARQKLEQASKNAKGEEARKAADQTLEKERQPATAKGQPKDPEKKQGDPSGQCAECKNGGKPGKDGKPGTGKQGPKQGDQVAKGQPKSEAPKGQGGTAKDEKGRGTDSFRNWFDNIAKGMKKENQGQGQGQDKKAAEEQAARDFAQMVRDLKSNDPVRREEARKRLDELAKAGKDEQGQGGKPGENKPLPKEAQKAVEELKNDLKSGDPGQRKRAEEALKELNRFAQGGKGEPKKGESGEGPKKPGEGVEEGLKRVAEGLKKDDKTPPPTREEAARELAKMLRDLKSDDPQRQQQARQKLEQLGKQAEQNQKKAEQEQREQANRPLPDDVKKAMQELGEDLRSKDPGRRQRAEEAMRALSATAGRTTGSRARQGEVDKPDQDTNIRADGRFRDLANILQLKKFNPKEYRKFLKENNLADEDVQDFIARRRAARVEKEEPKEPSAGTGTALPTTGISRYKPGTGKAKEVESSSDGLPLREYRDIYKEFTRRISEKEKRPGR